MSITCLSPVSCLAASLAAELGSRGWLDAGRQVTVADTDDDDDDDDDDGGGGGEGLSTQDDDAGFMAELLNGLGSP